MGTHYKGRLMLINQSEVTLVSLSHRKLPDFPLSVLSSFEERLYAQTTLEEMRSYAPLP